MKGIYNSCGGQLKAYKQYKSALMQMKGKNYRDPDHMKTYNQCKRALMHKKGKFNRECGQLKAYIRCTKELWCIQKAYLTGNVANQLHIWVREEL